MSHLRYNPTMQPKLVDAPPAGDGWLHEIKYDGYRTQLIIEEGSIRAFTRNGYDWTDKYVIICQDAKALACTSALIDGEVAIQDERGVTDFGGLRRAINHGPERLVFFAFDLLHLNGEDLRDRPLEERRAKLRWLLAGCFGRLVMSDEFAGEGADFFRLADQHGLEGIVSKRKGSKYRSGVTGRWVKTKCWTSGNFELAGIERDKDGAAHALLSSGGVYVGSAYLALPGDLREIFWRWTEKNKAGTGPFRKKGAQWLQPGLSASVRHLKGSDKLRHATVTDLRLAS